MKLLTAWCCTDCFKESFPLCNYQRYSIQGKKMKFSTVWRKQTPSEHVLLEWWINWKLKTHRLSLILRIWRKRLFRSTLIVQTFCIWIFLLSIIIVIWISHITSPVEHKVQYHSHNWIMIKSTNLKTHGA